jgi:hypothetical protein
MKSCRSLKVASLVGLVGASLFSGACVDDGASLHVVCPIVPDVDEVGCTFDPEGGECVLRGTLNLAGAIRYDSALRVESGFKPRESDSPPRSELNRVAFTGGEVEIRKASGAPLTFNGLKNPYPIIASGSAYPEERGVMYVTLIPSAYVDQLRENAASAEPLDQVVLAVKVQGRTDGQVEVEASEWLWPVSLYSESLDERDNSCARFENVCDVGVDQFAFACLACYDAAGDREACSEE